MERIEITRAAFEECFGIKPDPSSLGMMLYSTINSTKEFWEYKHQIPPTNGVQAEYVFIDEALPCENPKEVAELWRMFRL